MPIIGGNGETGISNIRDTIGNNGTNLGAYYKTPTGPTPASYTNVPTGGTIAYSQFRGGVTTAPPTSSGSAAFGGGRRVATNEYSLRNVPNYYGQTPPGGASPVGYLQPFVIPQYNDICFSLSGAGGTSGESIWDPSDVIKGGCVANGNPGNIGQASYLFGPNGGVTQDAPYNQSGFFHTFGNLNATVYPQIKTNGQELVFAGGGNGGQGAQWAGGCDGRNGGISNAAAGTSQGGGINPGAADPRDEVKIGGGQGGGEAVTYFGQPGSNGGGGGPATLVNKWFKRGGPGAPVPGQTWFIYLGFNNPMGANGGGWTRGFPAFCNINWS